MTLKEKQQEAEKIFATYMVLPEKEKIMLLAYSTALRDRALLDEQVKSDLPKALEKVTELSHYNRQQLDEYEQLLNQPISEPELAGK